MTIRGFRIDISYKCDNLYVSKMEEVSMVEKICNVSFVVDENAAKKMLERIRFSITDDERTDNEILESVFREFFANQLGLIKEVKAISVTEKEITK